MRSAESFREFIAERLTAAAEDIFGVFKSTIVEYEREIDRQCRLLDEARKPHSYLQTTDVPQQHGFEEAEVVTEQQLCNQERNFNLDQQEGEPPLITENQEGSREMDSAVVIDHSDEDLQNKQQLLSKNSVVAEIQDTKASEHVTVGLTAYEEEMSVSEVEDTDGQHNIMNMVKKLNIHLNRIDVPQLHVQKEEEVLAEQERNSSVDPQEPEPPQEQTGEQLTVKQKTDTAIVADHSEEELPNKCPLLSNDSQVAENQGTKVIEHKDSESTGKIKQKKKLERKLTETENPKRKKTESDCNREQQLLLNDSHVGENQDAKRSEHVQDETTADEFKKINRPCTLLDIVRKPRIYLHRIDAPQQRVIKEKVVTEQQLCYQDRTSSLDQEQPEPPVVKENQEGEQLEEEQNTDTTMLTDHSEGEAEYKQQLLSNDPHVDENKETQAGKHITEGLTVYEEEMSVYVEEESDGQHNMMHMAQTLHIHLRRIDVPQQHVFQKEEEVVAEQQLCNQERVSSLDQEDPEPPPIKGEQTGGQEMDTIILTDHSERVSIDQNVKVSEQEEAMLTSKSNPKRKKMIQERRNPKRKTSKNDC